MYEIPVWVKKAVSCELKIIKGILLVAGTAEVHFNELPLELGEFVVSIKHSDPAALMV